MSNELKKGSLRHTFEQEYVPLQPHAFTEAHTTLMHKALLWASSVSDYYELDMSRGEFVHEVLPPHRADTPGKRKIAVTAQFYSRQGQEFVNSQQAHLLRTLEAQRGIVKLPPENPSENPRGLALEPNYARANHHADTQPPQAPIANSLPHDPVPRFLKRSPL